MIIKPAAYADPNTWAVYSHTLDGATPAWIGYCRAAEVLCSPDAYKSPAWREAVAPAPAVALKVMSLHALEVEALRAAVAAVVALRPWVNLQTGPHGQGTRRAVQHVQSGRLFNTARAAAEAFGLFESQLSVHLRQRNPRPVKGHSFRRI